MIVSLIKTRQASAVARYKSRNGKEAIETVCNKHCAGFIVQVQVMATGQAFQAKG